MIRHGKTVAALSAVGALLLVGCRSDASTKSGDAPTTTAAAGTATSAAPATTTAGTTAGGSAGTTAETAAPGTTTAATAAPDEAWKANIDNCPASVTAPIEGDVKIGSAQPLSGPVAPAFSPVKDGIELYIQYANDNNLLKGHTMSIDIGDDQYDANQTPGVVSALIDQNAALFTAIIGSDNNLAVRDTLNEECIPQLLNLTGSPAWGDIDNYPWTTGALVPYDIETKIYAKKMKELGVKTVGMYRVNNEFGKIFSDSFREAAKTNGLEIVDDQTIEETDLTPPTNQLGSIAGKAPDAIIAVPLGQQCPIFTTELVKAKAVAGGWNPLVFQTNTCSPRLLISILAAGSGDGVYTSNFIVDPGDPKYVDLPAVKVFQAAYDAKGLTGDLATTVTGWEIGEFTVNILVKANESGTLTRQSIIEAARNLEFVPSLARDGTVYKMDGDKDPYSFQSLQVLQWDEASGTYKDIGPEDTEFES